MKTLRNVLALAVLGLLVASPAIAQDSGIWFEGRGGFALPTGDVGENHDAGPVFGGSLWYSPMDAKWAIGAEGDYSLHSAAEGHADMNVMHLMGKVGYTLFTSDNGKLSIMVTAGAGIMRFDFDVEGAEATSDLAISAGAKLHYMLSDRIGIVVSPQGDIAFVDSTGDESSTAWVWPLSGGIFIKI